MGSKKPSSATTDLSQSPFRWIVLIMLIFLVFSMIYCYDQLFALQNQLQDTYNLSPLQYNMLYSIYGSVNVILPLISGILIDYIGVNLSCLLFYSLIIIGQSIWIFACVISSYPIMVLGRGIFACGTQPFHTGRKYYLGKYNSFFYIFYNFFGQYLGKYFIGSEYLFASGLTISASRAASAIASFVSAQVYIAFDLISALLVGQILICIAFIFLICFLCYDYQQNKKQKNVENSPLLDTNDKNKNIENEHENKGFYLFESLKMFDRRFWILSFILGSFYASYMTFTANCSSLLQSRFGYEYDNANVLAMIPFFIAMITCPMFGYFCDMYGHKLSLLTLSAILLISSHGVIGFTDAQSRIWPIIGLIVFGFAMSLGSALLWPLMLLVVEKKFHASALGVSSIVDNGSQALSLVIAGVLTKDYTDGEHQRTDQYEYFIYWVLSLAVVMLILSLWLWTIDDSLNAKPKKMKGTNAKKHSESEMIETNGKSLEANNESFCTTASPVYCSTTIESN